MDVANNGTIDRQFCATCKFTDISDDIISSFESFFKTYDNEQEILQKCMGIANEAGIPLNLMIDGSLVAFMFADRIPSWDWDSEKMCDEWFGDGSVTIQVNSDLSVMFADGEDGGLILPEIYAGKPEDIVHIINSIINVLNEEHDEKDAAAVIMSIINKYNSSSAT
jgi:hypothetical protein